MKFYELIVGEDVRRPHCNGDLEDYLSGADSSALPDYFCHLEYKNLFSARVVKYLGGYLATWGALVELSGGRYFNFVPNVARIFDIKESSPVFFKEIRPKIENGVSLGLERVDGERILSLRHLKYFEWVDAQTTCSLGLNPPMPDTLFSRYFVERLHEIQARGYYLREYAEGCDFVVPSYLNSKLDRLPARGERHTMKTTNDNNK